MRITPAMVHGRNAARLIEQNLFEQAEQALFQAIQLDPGNPRFQCELGNLFRLRGMPAAAIFAYSETIKASPQFAPAYSARGAVLGEHKLFSEALDDHRRAVALAPADASVHLEMSGTLAALGDIAAAQASCRRAMELQPGSAEPWEQLGKALLINGRFAEAETAFRRSLQIKSSAEVALQLAMMRRPGNGDEFGMISALLGDPELSAKDRVSAGFALGKLLDGADRFDEAFSAYARANAQFKTLSAQRGHRFEIRAVRQKMDQTIATFTPSFFRERRGWGEASEMPVFIVGMPRSGTTLVEQVAASHSAVFAAGERFDISMMRSRFAATQQNDLPGDWRQDAIAREARGHLQRLAALSGGAQRVIDKMPGNLLELGLIALLFPGARVIICEREARDVCLSCFFQLFWNNHLLFSYDLADCGRQFNQNQRLVQHWKHALPLRTLHVQYEEFVADLEGQSRRLIDFLGLPWEERCLDFYKYDRPILTRSAWQARQPVYTRSVGRWKHYEKHLGPLVAALVEEA